jgi:hypothetical protein
MDELDFATWKLVQLVLWAGPFGILAFLAGCFFAGYFLGLRASRTKRADKPMQAAKLDHIKYDILPDGTLGPGDNRGLEGSE